MAGELGALSATRQQHALDAIERSRALLAASGDRLDRTEAALRRAAARAQRNQAEIDRAVAQGERDLARQPPDPGEQIEQAKALRKRLAETAAALAATEERVAQVHDELAARRPEHASDYRRIADEARQAASRAQEVGRQFAGPDGEGQATGQARNARGDPLSGRDSDRRAQASS